MQIVPQIASARDGARCRMALADMAETEDVRAVHDALEQLYRTPFVAMELASRLDAAI